MDLTHDHEAITETIRHISDSTGVGVAAVAVPGGWTIGIDGNCVLPEKLPPLSAHEVIAWLNGFLKGFIVSRDKIANSVDRN